jgi:hypothetical protein
LLGRDEDWRDDPSSDERWNAGVDCAMKLFCDYLGVDPSTVTWDAATETVDGDVSAVIGNILRTKYGEDWSPASPQEQPAASPLMGLPTLEQIEFVLMDFGIGNLDGPDGFRKRCAQRIFDVCAVASGIPIKPSDNKISSRPEEETQA